MVPSSILSSVVFTTLIGLAFLLVLTLAIPDVATIAAASDPVSAIVRHHLGGAATKLFLLCVVVAMLATALITMSLSVRIVFAMARDERLPAARLLGRVTSKGIPPFAVLLVTIIGLAVFLTARDLTSLMAVPVVLLTTIYLVTVVNAIFRAERLPEAPHYALGRWRKPIGTLAALWLLALIAILTVPEEFHEVAWIAGGLIAGSFALYAVMGRRR